MAKCTSSLSILPLEWFSNHSFFPFLPLQQQKTFLTHPEFPTKSVEAFTLAQLWDLFKPTINGSKLVLEFKLLSTSNLSSCCIINTRLKFQKAFIMSSSWQATVANVNPFWILNILHNLSTCLSHETSNYFLHKSSTQTCQVYLFFSKTALVILILDHNPNPSLSEF